jgi:hypothetical protein
MIVYTSIYRKYEADSSHIDGTAPLRRFAEKEREREKKGEEKAVN